MSSMSPKDTASTTRTFFEEVLSGILFATTATGLVHAPSALAETDNLRAIQRGEEIVIQEKGPRPSQAPPATQIGGSERVVLQSVAELATAYITAMDADARLKALARLAGSAPKTAEDLRRLLDIFARDSAARAAAAASLNRLSPRAQEFGPYFLGLIEDEDPFLKSFGLAGALRLRYAPALPAIHKLAESRFPHRTPSFQLGPQESNQWQNRFEALRALALWEGKDVLPLLLKKAKEAPQVAGLAASCCWEEGFDQFVLWSKSKSKDDQEAARAAWGAEVPPETLRATGPKLLALLLDRRSSMDIRHRAAVRFGTASGEAEAKLLLEKREEALKNKDEKTRLLLETALFASRTPLALPLLEEHARTNPAPEGRAGALIQLRGMVPAARYRELLSEAAAKDPDAENRDLFQRELAELK